MVLIQELTLKLSIKNNKVLKKHISNTNEYIINRSFNSLTITYISNRKYIWIEILRKNCILSSKNKPKAHLFRAFS